MTDTLTTDLWSDEEWRAAMSAADINDLPDSAFAYVEEGGEKDSGGKTTPRSLRHYPVPDESHARNAYARAQAQINAGGEPAAIAKKALPAILAACKKFGIDVEEKSATNAPNHIAVHEPFSGSHAHRHSPMGSQGDDETHNHEHSHDDDANHDHHQRSQASELERRKALAESLSRGGESLLPGGMERRSANTGPIEARSADDGKLHISGYASVFDRAYDMGLYDETVKRGAFTKTLQGSPQVHLLLNHSGLPLASTINGSLQLREDSVGLHFDAALDPDDPDSQAAYRKVKTGLMQECSFAFRAIKQAWNDDYSKRDLTEVSIDKGDTSICNFGASPHTSVSARSLDGFEREAVRYALDLIEAEGPNGVVGLDRVRGLLSAIVETRTDADGDDDAEPCPTCDGAGTIMDGNRTCPDCGGSGEASEQSNSAITAPEFRSVVVGLMEPRAGATLSSATMSKLQEVLDLIDASDTNVDKALIALSALMGVTNPDIAQDAALDRDAPEENQAPVFTFFQTNSADDQAELLAMSLPPRRAAE